MARISALFFLDSHADGLFRHVAHAPLPVIPRAARLVNLFTAGLLAHPCRNAPSRRPQSPSMGLRMAKPPAEVLAHSVARGIPCPMHCSEKRIHSYGYSRSLALRSLLAPPPYPRAGWRRTVVARAKLAKKRQTPKPLPRFFQQQSANTGFPTAFSKQPLHYCGKLLDIC